MHLLHIAVADGIGTITLDRPEKRNALSAEMVAAISEAFVRLRADDAVRVIVLRGNGPAFCAGADLGYLQQISQNSPTENLADSTRLMEMMRSIADCPKPVIAMVHGPAIAGGCGLATVCDLVVASRSESLFGYSEVKIGFIPAIVLVFLLRKIGDTQARRLVLTAENISAEEAHRIGLITHVVDHADLERTVYEIAGVIAKNSATSLELTKHMLTNLHGMSLDAGLHYAAAMNALARQTDDCKNGIARFLNAQKG